MEKNKLSKLSQTVFLKTKESNEDILNTVSNHNLECIDQMAQLLTNHFLNLEEMKIIEMYTKITFLRLYQNLKINNEFVVGRTIYNFFDDMLALTSLNLIENGESLSYFVEAQIQNLFNLVVPDIKIQVRAESVIEQSPTHQIKFVVRIIHSDHPLDIRQINHLTKFIIGTFSFVNKLFIISGSIIVGNNEYFDLSIDKGIVDDKKITGWSKICPFWKDHVLNNELFWTDHYFPFGQPETETIQTEDDEDWQFDSKTVIQLFHFVKCLDVDNCGTLSDGQLSFESEYSDIPLLPRTEEVFLTENAVSDTMGVSSFNEPTPESQYQNLEQDLSVPPMPREEKENKPSEKPKEKWEPTDEDLLHLWETVKKNDTVNSGLLFLHDHYCIPCVENIRPYKEIVDFFKLYAMETKENLESYIERCKLPIKSFEMPDPQCIVVHLDEDHFTTKSPKKMICFEENSKIKI